jgi:excisionase family DNA binding protein
MKIEIDDKALIDEIAKKVIEHITPLLKGTLQGKDNELMTVDEVAKYLKVKVSWVYDKIHRKEIPFQKVGKFPRFKKKYIDAWLKNPYSPELDIFNLNHNKRR